MAYIVPIHRPTSVRHALKLRLLSSEEECLVLAKANRLEIYNQTEDGLVLSHSRALYGKVTMLDKLRPSSSATEHLFVGTDRYMYFTVSWDAQSRRLRTETSYQDQADKTLRDSQTEDQCLIDPTRRFMALLLFDGIVTIVPIAHKGKRKGSGEIGTLGEPVPARISDLFVRSAAFLFPQPGEGEQAQLAFLYEDNHQKVCMSVRKLDYAAGVAGESGSADLENVVGAREDLELGASHLIPVPAPAYGLVVLAETSISYLGHINGDFIHMSLEDATQFVAWTSIDDQRWLLADEFGEIYLLMLLLESGNEVTGCKLDKIGNASRASVLVYLGNGYLFVGSHQGDSQMVKIQAGYLDLVQTLSNIAPVLDFSIMDMGNRAGEGQTNEYSSGQARIVTGSGAFQDGSLRSVRSGVGLEEQGILGQIAYATDLFGVRSNLTIDKVDVLIVSFVNQTRIFEFQANGEVEELADFQGFSLSECTLFAADLPRGHLLQVTESAVRLIDLENGMINSEWFPPSGQVITAASANDQNLALSLGGKEAVILELAGSLQVLARRQFAEEEEISCIHVSNVSSEVCIAGFWHSASVLIMKINTLETVLQVPERVDSEDEAVSVPRSILLAQVLHDQLPTLFIAMTDGEVVTYSINLASFTLSSKNCIILGTQQASFKALPKDDGVSNVFATCEHSSLIYGSEGRIVYSAVTAEKASRICSFDSDAYPGAIAIATPEDIRIALIDTERATHVNTLHVGETVRRIAYSTKLKAFGIGTIRRSIRQSQEIVQSHFKLADEVLLEVKDTYELNEDELVESVVRADLREDSGEPIERFVVGTSYLCDDSDESIRGRIIVFAVTTERKLKVITDLPVKGACRALGVIDGKIVAALVKTVVIYSLENSHLNKRATYRCSTAPIDLSIHGSQIAIADLMKSVSILTYTRGTAGSDDKLRETARHYQTAWSTAVAHVGGDPSFENVTGVSEDTWLEADAEGNLVVLARNNKGVTADDRRRLGITNELRLGEMVNRIRSVSIDSFSPTAPVIPKAFLSTVDGSIYLFGFMTNHHSNTLLQLQETLVPYVQSLGHVPWKTYRAFKSQVREAEEPFRFVDGELVEAFLDLAPELQQEVVGRVVDVIKTVDKSFKGTNGDDIGWVRNLVEQLRRLH